MAKLRSIDLRPGPSPEPGPVADVETLAAALPRLESADVARLRSEPRAMFAINNLQVSIRDRFMEEARRRGWTHKQLFIEMMRKWGVDLPPYDQLDARRR